MNNYTYTYACRNIFNTIKTSGHSSLEKYTSHFIERVVCERWVRDWTKTATYWPSPAPLAIAVRLFRSPGLLNRGLRAQPLCWELVPTARSGTLTSSSELQLPNLLSHPGYIIVLRPLNSTRRQSRYPLISSTGCTRHLHRCISHLTAWPGQRSICNSSKRLDLSSFLNDVSSEENIEKQFWIWRSVMTRWP